MAVMTSSATLTWHTTLIASHIAYDLGIKFCSVMRSLRLMAGLACLGSHKPPPRLEQVNRSMLASLFRLSILPGKRTVQQQACIVSQVDEIDLASLFKSAANSPPSGGSRSSPSAKVQQQQQQASAPEAPSKGQPWVLALLGGVAGTAAALWQTNKVWSLDLHKPQGAPSFLLT